MIRTKQSISIFFMAFGLIQSAFAMEESAFVREFNEKYGDFTTLPANIIEQTINYVPAQTETWSCGKHQCGHLSAFSRGCKELPRPLNFKQPRDYPLSVDINTKQGQIASYCEMIPQIAEMLRTDDKGNFRVGPTPDQMAGFINEYILPEGVDYHAVGFSENKLSQSQFLNIVKRNIERNLPTIAYFVVSAEARLMHVNSIVGYREGKKTDEVLVLDSYGKGFNRLSVMTVEKFHAALDASSIIKTVNLIDTLGGFVGLRRMIESEGGKLASRESLAKWKTYSLITFEEGEGDDVEGEEDQVSTPVSTEAHNPLLQFVASSMLQHGGGINLGGFDLGNLGNLGNLFGGKW